MNIQLYNALRALCLMWEQYCAGPSSHLFMEAGEHTEEVLESHGLLITTNNGIEQRVNWGRLQQLYLLVHDSDDGDTSHIDTPPADQYEF